MKRWWVVLLFICATISVCWVLIDRSARRSKDENHKALNKPSTSVFEYKLTPDTQNGRVDWETKPWLAHLAPEYQVSGAANWWKAPITFWGIVIDEKGAPLNAIPVEVIISDTSRQGTSMYRLHSSADGRFEFQGKRGRGISVQVSREGYYPTTSSVQHFNYGGEGETKAFRPDPQNPVKFKLHKMGKAEPLICSRELFGFPPDGVPRYVDLIQNKIYQSPIPGPGIRVIFKRGKELPGKKYDWGLTLEAIEPGAGMQWSDEEIITKAPEDGYLEKLELIRHAQDKSWESQEERVLIFRGKNGETYARVHLLVIPNYNGDSAIDWTSFVNPDGSRNLEYDAAKTIKVRRTHSGLELQYPEPAVGVAN